jgi:triacylglycerol lipase
LPFTLPIMLSHGICPFTRLFYPLGVGDNRPDDRFHYFRLIRSALVRKGYTVFHTRVAWAAGVDERARNLRDELIRLTQGFRLWPRVHIIAHSMGGLDARHMLLRYRMEGRVASLTSIGTPHLGTSYADWGLRRFDRLIDLSRSLGLNLDGLRDLTREKCLRFNEAAASYEENNGVLYRTVAGTQPLERIFLPMRPASRIIRDEEGVNDGLVSRTSAVWKEEYHLATIDADHLNQIGWWSPAEARSGISRKEFETRIRAFYVELASGLRPPEKGNADPRTRGTAEGW